MIGNESLAIMKQAVGEAVGGFASETFDPVKKEKATKLLHKVDAGQISFSEDEQDILRDCLQFALDTLGPEEFQTVTGYTFFEGTTALRGIAK